MRPAMLWTDDVEEVGPDLVTGEARTGSTAVCDLMLQRID